MAKKMHRIVYANPKSDSERRAQQAAKVVRIIRVHKLSCHLNPRQDHSPMTIDDVLKIAKELGVSERTIWRDIATLKLVYDAIGSSLIDN